MKLFYINDKNVMGRDCDIPTKDCQIADYMRSQAFDVKTKRLDNIHSILFESSFHVSDLERGMHVIAMANVCAECQSKKEKWREKAHEKTR